MKLTQAKIATLSCPPGKRDALFFDEDQRGLGVRVTGVGSRTYVAQYTFHGQKRRVPLGSCEAISLAKAREAARAIMGEVAKGFDPVAERKKVAAAARQREAQAALTLARLIDDWRELHLANRRESYALEAVRSLRRAFVDHLDFPAAEIDRALVVKLFDGMAREGSAMAATHAAAYGKACYGWAIKRGTLASNPFVNLPLAPIAKRERILSDDELLAIWRATAEVGAFNGIVRALILTGQRRDEIAGMAWGELSDDLSTWTIPGARAKNGAASIVPLAAPVRDMLRAYPRAGELVFSGRAGVFSGWSRAKAALDARSGVKDWRLHDLRRTVATGLQRLGVRLEVTEAILNHVAGSRAGIVGLYQRHDYAREKEVALTAWAAHVFALVEERANAGDVVPLAKEKAAS